MTTTRSVAANTLYLSLAQGIRILLSFVLILFIANRFGPVWQGKFSILLAFLNIFQVLASFGLPRLLTREVARTVVGSNDLPPAESDNRFFWAGLAVQSLTTVIMMAIMAAVVALTPYPADTQMMLWLAVLTLPLFTLYSVAGALLRAHERMQWLVFAEVFSSIAQLVAAFLLLSISASVMALAVIRIAGIGLAAVVVVVATLSLGLVGKPQFDLGFARRLWADSFDFFGMAAFDALLQRLDIIILSLLAGEAVTGIYDAAFRIIQILMTLVMSFADAAYPTLSRLYAHHRERFALAASKSLYYGLVVLLPVAAGMTVLAPKLVALVYRREGYESTGAVLAVLSWALLAYFVQIFLTRLLMASDRTRVAFRLTVLMVVLGAGVLAISSLLWGPVGTAWGLAILYLSGALLAGRASLDYGFTLNSACLARSGLAAALMGVVLYYLLGAETPPLLAIGIALPLGVGMYTLLAFGMGVLDRDDMQVIRAVHAWLLRRSSPT